MSYEIKTKYQNHKQLIIDYRNLKSYSMEPKSDTLVIEFDYCQNKPIPKLPISQAFYLRFSWIYLFNIHIHNNDKSFMFYFLEGEYKKGCNTVISFLNYVLKLLITPNIKNIIIFSDSCFAQNKNSFLVMFLNLISLKWKVNISHIYPIKGHSFCRCDSNFSLISRKLKNFETIESNETF